MPAAFGPLINPTLNNPVNIESSKRRAGHPRRAGISRRSPWMGAAALTLIAGLAHGQELPADTEAAAETPATSLDTVTVTATRSERYSREVTESIAVIDEARIEAAPMFNVSDALRGTPGVLIESMNGGYDARIFIRGAGLKANYGVRELMLLRDGVPVTDPDSFTRLDFVDTQDIQRIEVVKGPGNIYATGSAGGVIHLISRSVFDRGADQIKLGIGDYGARNLHARIGRDIGSRQAMSLTLSYREKNNDWRPQNAFETVNAALKHGITFDDGAVLESELAYNDASLELPGSMNQAQYDEYRRTGEQTDNNTAFDDSGRYSETWSFNSRYLKPVGAALVFRPRVYAAYWQHLHPITGQISEVPRNLMLGTDLEFAHRHQLLGLSELVAGVTLRRDDGDSRSYEYGDVQTIPSGRIIATRSDRRGDLAGTSQTTNDVRGIFAQETVRPADGWLIDLGFRLDRISINEDADERSTYDFVSGTYVDGAGTTRLNQAFDLFNARLGANYALSETLNLFGVVAQGEQVPYSSELADNPALNPATVRNVEIGLKGRARHWAFDISMFQMKVEDEIIQVLEDVNDTSFQNAGRTDKSGVELASNFELTDGLWAGFNYTYSDFRYDDFVEVVSGTEFDRSGNRLPQIPRHQYSVFASYRHPIGVSARVQTDTWGEYEVDNANSETFDGYDWVTSLDLAYETGPHKVSAHAQNLFDERYAVRVTKSRELAYTPGAPRSLLISYRYQF
ncbi:TonB-dependent receptor [Sinimarinibacterium sp. CAU 1509]|uniref:TonB-dependent receptor n=1 Tax=Sinimarinibacterium sp. CAU 1509 TaxID=2562283 RepID=UPI00146C39AF|nr:TonB-dependent receptor [Sinimarinibacterium sp. CAU 1509]